MALHIHDVQRAVVTVRTGGQERIFTVLGESKIVRSDIVRERDSLYDLVSSRVDNDDLASVRAPFKALLARFELVRCAHPEFLAIRRHSNLMKEGHFRACDLLDFLLR